MKMSFKRFLVNEIKKYDYSSILFELPEELTDNIISWGFDNIGNDDLIYDEIDPDFGREDYIHVTITYGIHSEHDKECRDLLKNENKVMCQLGEMTLFTKNDNFDVLVINVLSHGLHNLNKKINLSVNTTQLHSEYKPHITIAYLKKGAGKQFIGDKTFDGEKFEIDKIVFSSKNGIKTCIKLKGKNE